MTAVFREEIEVQSCIYYSSPELTTEVSQIGLEYEQNWPASQPASQSLQTEVRGRGQRASAVTAATEEDPVVVR